MTSTSVVTERPRTSAPLAAMERHPWRAFVLLTLIYVAVVLAISSLKVLWLDELITLHIARLATVHQIWEALERGADPNPPLSHILVHYSRLVFGEHEFALRLPAMAGYWIGLASLFAYLCRRLPAMWALGGTILSMTMAAFDYSFESRSYGIFYGLAMLAFLCWTRAVDDGPGKERRGWLAGMVFALAAGIATNYFAVLAFVPIAAGEAARTIQRAVELRCNLPRNSGTVRAALLASFDPAVWICLAIAAIPFFAFLPLINRSIAQFAPTAWNKVTLGQLSDSYTEMVEIVLYPILALLLLNGAARAFAGLCEDCRRRFWSRWMRRAGETFRSRSGILPAYETIGVLCLMAYPVLGYIVASVHGGMLSPRFVIPVCYGFAIAATVASYQLFRSYPRSGVVFAGFFLVWFLCRESVVGYWYEEQKQCLYKVIDHIPQAEAMAPPGTAILVPDPLLLLTLDHYAPPAIADRIVFPVAFSALRRYRHYDSPEQNLWAGRGYLYHIPLVPLNQLLQSSGRHLIVADDGNWLLDDLSDQGYSLRQLPIDTRAGAMGGFTPVSKGKPMFYVSTAGRNTAGQSSGL